jgi:hypothetical protein
VIFKRRALEWLRSELAEYSVGEIVRFLQGHVVSGGNLDKVVERRLEYVHHEFHYDMRVSIGGRRVYFESILSCEDVEDPDSFTIVVVNAKDA